MKNKDRYINEKFKDEWIAREYGSYEDGAKLGITL